MNHEPSQSNRCVLVAGGGGFIGGHLVDRLLRDGFQVRSVDIKPISEWEQFFDEAENLVLDLRDREACTRAVSGVQQVYNLAADMGGMGFIERNKARCMLSVVINTNLLEASVQAQIRRYFFASSACVYPLSAQTSTDSVSLAEDDAYPANPEDGYGWEKLFSERMCRHFREDFGVDTRVGRLHNVYGPNGTWRGGREKAPAAICRKVAEAKLSGDRKVEVWGDGEQTRSFTYIDDCVHGIRLLMESEFADPLNIGSSECVSISHLLFLVADIANVEVQPIYRHEAPLGVRGRNSDNTLIRSRFDWEPETPLKLGLTKTFGWIWRQLTSSVGRPPRPQRCEARSDTSLPS